MNLKEKKRKTKGPRIDRNTPESEDEQKMWARAQAARDAMKAD